MRVVAVPCLSDNYSYLVVADGSRAATVIDPADAGRIGRALEHEGLELAAIVCTHHHADHIGGNEELVARNPGIPVFAHGSDAGRVPCQTEHVEDEADFQIAGLAFTPLHVPGHTLGGVAYVAGGSVFTGDTLFVAGCGRLFEGTAAQMLESLARLGALPSETLIYCGHEYAISNLRFAATVEPSNDAIRVKLDQVHRIRARGEATIPSTIADELATNPFLRCDSPAIRQCFSGATAADRFAAVRTLKDSFR